MEEFAAKLVNFIASFKPYNQVGIGTASGFLTGFFIMKIGKFAVAVLGGVIILLKMAEIEGFIHINWLKVTKDVQNISLMPLGNLTNNNADEMLSNIQNFVISFFGGSLIGIGFS